MKFMPAAGALLMASMRHTCYIFCDYVNKLYIIYI